MCFVNWAVADDERVRAAHGRNTYKPAVMIEGKKCCSASILRALAEPELFMSDLLRGRKSIRGFVMLRNSPSTYCFNTPAEELLAFLATNVLTTSRHDLHE